MKRKELKQVKPKKQKRKKNTLTKYAIEANGHRFVTECIFQIRNSIVATIFGKPTPVNDTNMASYFMDGQTNGSFLSIGRID